METEATGIHRIVAMITILKEKVDNQQQMIDTLHNILQGQIQINMCILGILSDSKDPVVEELRKKVEG